MARRRGMKIADQFAFGAHRVIRIGVQYANRRRVEHQEMNGEPNLVPHGGQVYSGGVAQIRRRGGGQQSVEPGPPEPEATQVGGPDQVLLGDQGIEQPVCRCGWHVQRSRDLLRGYPPRPSAATVSRISNEFETVLG